MAIIRLQGEEEKRKNIYFEVDTADAPIGEGGMGKVMRGKCVDVATNVSRPVAIKFLFADLPAHAIERARREASIRLRNDNLIEMIGFVEVRTPGPAGQQMVHYHVVSELLHGVSLSDLFEGKCTDGNGKEIAFAKKLLKDYQSDPCHFAKFIVSKVLNGLIALHDAGYVHRDIDPSNIMLTEDGHVKLIDFGIAKLQNKLTTSDKGLTTAGVFMGKAEYAAPELALGDLRHQDQTTDIYAMGILLYQCIVGHVPFEGQAHEVLDKQLHKKLPLATVKDRGLRRVVECATEKNQKQRYQSAAQMLVALETLDGKKREMSKTVKTAIIAAIVIVVAAVGLSIAMSVHNDKVAQRQAEEAAAAVDDSLRTVVQQAFAEAKVSVAVGDKHDEAYETAYVEAYQKMTDALDDASKMTDGSAKTAEITAERNKLKEKLIKAKDELQGKADMFATDGMEDIAAEFRKRVENINNTINQ